MPATAAPALTHLKVQKDGDYEYQDRDNPVEMKQRVDAVFVSISYYKDGKRGIRLNIDRRGVERWEYGFTFEMALFRGYGAFLVPLARKNPKAMLAVAQRLDAIVPKLAEIWRGVPAKSVMTPEERKIETDTKDHISLLLIDAMAGFAV